MDGIKQRPPGGGRLHRPAISIDRQRRSGPRPTNPARRPRFRRNETEMPLPASLVGTLELPVIGSPLFIVSGPELVIAQCKAGIVGSFPALNARPVEKLDEWLTRIEDELGEYKARASGRRRSRPIAVNQIVPRLQRPADAGHGDLRQAPGAASSSPACGRRPKSSTPRTPTAASVFHDVINVATRARPPSGRRRPDPGLRRRRRARRHAVAVRAAARSAQILRRAPSLLSGAISDGASIARGAGDRRRPRLHGHALHRHRGGECRPTPTSR